MTFKLTPKQVEGNKLLASAASNIMLRGGSRSGKTFLICRAIYQRAINAPGSRHAIWRHRFNHAKTSLWSDTLPKVRKICFPNLTVVPNKSDFYLELPNESQIWIGGLDDKDRVEKVLGQEYATIYYNEASQISWSSIETGMSRLAQNIELAPEIAAITGRTHLNLKAIFDCNPPSKLHWSYSLFREKMKPGTKEALANPEDYAEMQMNPDDNRENLPPKYFEILDNMSAAKRRRFRDGEWASEVEGAFWTYEMIDAARQSDLPDMQRIVIAVDPSGTKGQGGGDDIGIVAAGKGTDGNFYVLADRSCNMSPAQWGARAVHTYHEFEADLIVGERNYGGAMVEAVIRAADKLVKYKEVTATRGKVVRAEPIAALYENGKVKHAGNFPDLEDQLCNMTAAGYVGEGSPDRADAMVWALTELMGGSSYNLDNL